MIRISNNSLAKIKKIISFFLLVCLLFSFLSLQISAIGNYSPDKEALDAYLKAEIISANLPSLVLGVVQGDTVKYLQTFNNPNYKENVVLPSSIMLTGAISKVMTISLALQLASDSKLKLDETIIHYLPNIPWAEQAGANLVTVRMLLLGTSGISGKDKWSHVKSFNKAGNSYADADANYVLLQKILAAVSGLDFGSLLREKLFVPLTMKHSYVKQQDVEGKFSNGYATKFGFNFLMSSIINEEKLSLGYIASSPDDLCKFMKFLNTGESANGKLILLPEYLGLLQKDLVITQAGALDKSYTMGFQKEKFTGVNVLRMESGVENYYATIALVPKYEAAIFMLSNANHALTTASILSKIFTSVLNILMGKVAFHTGFDFFTQYLLIDVATILVLLSLFFSLISLSGWKSKVKAGMLNLQHSAVLPFLYNFLIPLIFIIGLPLLLDRSWKNILELIPDIGLLGLIVALMNMLIGILKILIYFLYHKKDWSFKAPKQKKAKTLKFKKR
ncbi:MAG: serine hydrolase domain-containing protein [Clostridia bacterium]